MRRIATMFYLPAGKEMRFLMDPYTLDRYNKAEK